MSYATNASASDTLQYTGTNSGVLSAAQTPDSFMGRSGWASYIICNHGDGATYYSQTIALPFWDEPLYRRLEGGEDRGWVEFITSSSKHQTKSGNLTCANFYASSDRHKKKHIQSIDRRSLSDLFDVSDKLLKQFTWKESGKISYGFIAQQLEKYIPEAVTQDNKGVKSVSYDIAYAKILASMIQEIKVLKKQLEAMNI